MPVIPWEIIASHKVTLGTVIVCVLIFIWIGDTFVTKTEAADYNSQVTAQISDNTTLLTALTKEIRVGAAYDRVDTLEVKVYAMRRDDADPALLEDEEKRLGRATAYRDCLLDNKPNCELLAKQIK